MSLAAHPAVPEDRRIYAVGDVHGRADLLTELHRRIAADAGAAQIRQRTVIYLGDYVDRGPGSAAVIDLLLDEPLPGFTAIHLLGNHERLLLEFLADARVGPTWFLNGGVATLASYGVTIDPWQMGDPTVLRQAQVAFGVALPARHRRFLLGLKLMHREGDYAFVHAGVRPGVPLTEQHEDDLIWIREPFLLSRDDFGAVVVHGHTIVERPQVHANRIAIDTGAYRSNHLTALALEGSTRRFLST